MIIRLGLKPSKSSECVFDGGRMGESEQIIKTILDIL